MLQKYRKRGKGSVRRHLGMDIHTIYEVGEKIPTLTTYLSCAEKEKARKHKKRKDQEE